MVTVMERKFVGLDLGVRSIKLVILNQQAKLVKKDSELVSGNSLASLKNLLERNSPHLNGKRLFVAMTGSGLTSLELPGDVFRINEITSLAYGARHLFPEARSVFDIGAETARWVQLAPVNNGNASPEIADFSFNERCAAGTGLFLEQQAYRLKLPLEMFSELAASAKRGARIAGRCSVFAKSDMIHLQQKGTPVEEIAYGVCLALARSVSSSLLKGRKCELPIALAGGTTKNAGLVRALAEILKAGENQILYSEDSPYLAAFGAALLAAGNSYKEPPTSLKKLLNEIKTGQEKNERQLAPLGQLISQPALEPVNTFENAVEAYLGIDVGSVSTNLVLFSQEGQVLTGVYLPTRGQPLEALKEGFKELLNRCPAGLKILGIGTTGSGRYLAGRLLQADSVKNEITCQRRSACYYFPEVDTIFEIGGQDSKYIQVEKGQVVDFNLNKICAAGTGSFLEEQASQLGFKVETDFAHLASLSTRPYDLGSRCTVFMESELVRAASENCPLPDLIAGLAYAIARNYLEKVVERRPVGKTIVFQGGVASNQAVVRAFSLLLGRKINVHPYHRISGAIGAALEARDKVKKSGKKSLDTEKVKEKLLQPFQLATFECRHCANRCQVVSVLAGKETVFFGDICERYTARSKLDEAKPEFHNPLVHRKKILEEIINSPEPQPASQLTIGLPRASTFQEFLPFWISFFRFLRYRVKVSPETSQEIIEAGIRLQPAETCLPVKAALGHLNHLQEDPEVDMVFLPSLLDDHRLNGESFYFCPYTEHLPSMLPDSLRQKLLTAPLYLKPEEDTLKENFQTLSRLLNEPENKVRAAWQIAWKSQLAFQQKLRAKGGELLSQADDKNVLVISGRPYLLYDNHLNLNLWFHLEKMGITVVPFDYLPLENLNLAELPLDTGDVPPWRYPRQLLLALLWSLRRNRAFPVFLTNYGCGVDGFTIKHLKNLVASRPHLILEFDEHRGEAGLITRLEALIDQIAPSRSPERSLRLRKKVRSPEIRQPKELKKLPFIIPYFADHAFAFTGALRKSGFRAKVLPPPDEQSPKLGEKYSSGKECHAYSFLLGDLLKYSLSENTARPAVFFFPGARYACLLQQYGPAMRHLLSDLNISDLLVLTPTLDYLWKLIGFDGLKSLWQGLVAVDFLVRISCQIRPYEMNRGETDRVFQKSLRRLEEGLAASRLEEALENIRSDLMGIRTKTESRPIIGIAGDIYTRQNPWANNQLYSHLERLGCEVWPPPFLVDEVEFSFSKEFHQKVATGRLAEAFKYAFLNLVKTLKKQDVIKRLKITDLKIKEPDFKELVGSTVTYLNYNNNQTLFLNIARMIDLAKKGADGIVNVICFNCMLGTASAAIAARIRNDFDRIPLPTLVFGETEMTSELPRLEAFVEQVKARWKSKA